MGLFPIIMNVLQFWLIDSIVKAHDPPAFADDPSGHDPSDREPLFQADGSEEEDETADEPGFTSPKYDDGDREPLIRATATLNSHSPSLTPDSKSFPSGSSTPFRGEVNPGDVAMKRVHSPPPAPQRPAAVNPNVLTPENEWAWNEAEEEWDTKRSLDALRPHQD